MDKQFGVALAQVNLVVGDLHGNRKRILEAALHARDTLHCRFVVFPELTISGYPPEDLLFRQNFVQECESMLRSLKSAVPEIALVIGHPHNSQGHLYNAATLIDRGELVATYCKQHLPNYGVFDEKRYFREGSGSSVVKIDGVSIGLTICEDVWDDGPVEQAVQNGAEIVFTLNGSPFDTSKISYREKDVVSKRSKRNKVSIVYVNLVGGQDELVFDGGSIVTNSEGEIVLRAPHFEESIVRITYQKTPDLQVVPGTVIESPNFLSSIYSAIKLGVSDYIRKNGFQGAIVGASGGIDSGLTLAVLADAIGPENVEAILMPSQYTSSISIEDAVTEAENLGVSYSIIPIDKIVQSTLRQLKPSFAGTEPDVTEENIQARTRGMLLMALSNKKRKLVISTGNKSEVAVGYATLYGDMAGGYSAIKDVPKTIVYELANYRNREMGRVIPERVLTREPTAELAPNQRDSDSLPPYEILDPILELYVEYAQSAEEIIQEGFEPAVVRQVIQMVKRNEYKRRQACPGVRITPKAFGRDRRYPITNQYY